MQFSVPFGKVFVKEYRKVYYTGRYSILFRAVQITVPYGTVNGNVRYRSVQFTVQYGTVYGTVR